MMVDPDGQQAAPTTMWMWHRESRSQVKGILNEQINSLQNKLDYAGMTPVVGDGIDAINGSMYLARGKNVDAAIAFAGIATPVGMNVAFKESGKLFKIAGDAIFSEGSNGFKSFEAFKRAIGSAGEGRHWHHIVGQTKENIAKFGAETIHNANNLLSIDAKTHGKISAYYSSKFDWTSGKTVREWVGSQPIEKQKEFGTKVLRDFGVIK